MEDQEQSDIHHTNITDISQEPSHTKYNNNFPDLLRIVGKLFIFITMMAHSIFVPSRKFKTIPIEFAR